MTIHTSTDPRHQSAEYDIDQLFVIGLVCGMKAGTDRITPTYGKDGHYEPQEEGIALVGRLSSAPVLGLLCQAQSKDLTTFQTQAGRANPARGRGRGRGDSGGEEVDVDEHNLHPNRNPWRNVSLNRTKCGEGLAFFFFMFCSDIVFLFTLAAFVPSKLQLIHECNLSH